MLSRLLVAAKNLQDRVQLFLSPFDTIVNRVLDVPKQVLDGGGGLHPPDASLVLDILVIHRSL